MKSLHSKSRLTKSLVRSGIIVASLALAGNAFAAAPHHVAHRATATAHRQVVWQQQAFPFVAGLLGLPLAGSVTIHAAHATRGSADSSGGYDPTFDTPSPTVDVDNSQSQAAIDATDQAIQQTDQDTFQMDESVINNE